ncbi:MAG: response regulator [Betaproteobacteria bacterium]
MKVLVVDDHSLIREALRNVLMEIDRGCELLESADSAGALRIAAARPDIDLVLLDLNLPDADGFATLEELRRRRPATAVVMLSAQNDHQLVTRSIALGAAGYIPKSTLHEVMVSALRLVCSGGMYLPPEVLAGAGMRLAEPQLTARERQVLALMLEGKSNKRISRHLGMAEATVKNHVTAILKALGASNRTEAVIAAGRLGWKPGAGAPGSGVP